MTAPESVDGRSTPRYSGRPKRHLVRWSGAGDPGYRDGGLLGTCTCGSNIRIDGDQPVAKLIKAERQHKGQET